MKESYFSNSNIDLACEAVGTFLASAGVERREALRVKLTLEEALLQYQEKFGTDAGFSLRLVKRLSSLRVELIVPGESYDALGSDREEDDVIRGLLAGVGLAPAWSYKSGRNHIIFTPKKKPLSSTTKMIAAIVLAVITGVLLNLLPENIRTGVNDLLLTPVSNALTGLISAVSGPLIFLSVLGSICSMGNMDTFGKIGTKTIKVILIYMSVIGLLMTALGSLYYSVKWGSVGSTSFSQVLDLIYDIIPSNLFEPFITGNTLQLIFIAIMVGLSMLVLSSRVNRVFELVEQLSTLVRTIMSTLSSMLPGLIFLIFTGMISSGNLSTILNSWKSVVIILVLMMVYYIVNLFRIAITHRVSPLVLWKKTMPTFMIAFSTASSAAAFTTNVNDAHKRLGIDKKLVEFATPLGQVLFMPAYLAMLFGTEAGLAEVCGIPITIPWLFIGLVSNLLVAFAVPPIPGAAALGFAVVFAQLGIPVEMMALAVAINAIPDFPATAVHTSGWQLTLIDVADSLDLLDKETLRKDI